MSFYKIKNKKNKKFQGWITVGWVCAEFGVVGIQKKVVRMWER